jgi:hypothetical protein
MYVFDQCIVYIIVFYYDKFYIWRVLDLVWIYRLRNIIQYYWLIVIVWPSWLVFYVYWLKMCRCCRWYRLLLWCGGSCINVWSMGWINKWNEMGNLNLEILTKKKSVSNVIRNLYTLRNKLTKIKMKQIISVLHHLMTKFWILYFSLVLYAVYISNAAPLILCLYFSGWLWTILYYISSYTLFQPWELSRNKYSVCKNSW